MKRILITWGTGSWRNELTKQLLKDEQNEIIICDDHSKEDEFDMIKSIVKNYNGKCNSISLHRNEINLGYQKNWNKCVELANNEMFHILHADDIFHKMK